MVFSCLQLSDPQSSRTVKSQHQKIATSKQIATSKRKPPINHQSLPSHKPRLIARQINRQRRDLLGRAQPPHRLTRNKGRSRRIDRPRRASIRGNPFIQARRPHRARAKTVAANPLCHEIHRNRARHADHRCLGRAIDEAVRNALQARRHRGYVDDRSPAPLQHHAAGTPAWCETSSGNSDRTRTTTPPRWLQAACPDAQRRRS